MLYPLITYPDPYLNRPAHPVVNYKPEAHLDSLAVDMLDTMRKWGGVGLAAPQVGISLRFIVAEVKGMTWVLANPEIIGRGTREVWDTEGCLSIPGYTRMVRRSRRVTVQAMQLIDGQWIEVFIEAKDLLARVLQHEIDHLNGILIKPQG